MGKYVIQIEWDTIKKRNRFYGYDVRGDSRLAVVCEDTAQEAERQIRAYHESKVNPVIVMELEL